MLRTRRGTLIVSNSESCDRRSFPIRYKPVRNAITTHVASTLERVKMPQSHTKSTLLRNLHDAASSRNPITTFTELSQPPLLGIFAKYWGKSAKKKKGIANAAEKNNIPINGQSQSP